MIHLYSENELLEIRHDFYACDFSVDFLNVTIFEDGQKAYRPTYIVDHDGTRGRNIDAELLLKVYLKFYDIVKKYGISISEQRPLTGNLVQYLCNDGNKLLKLHDSLDLETLEEYLLILFVD